MTRLALRIGLLALATCPALAQQELYGLGRFNKIWRIDGYDTATPTLTEITTWGFAASGVPIGLERDPATGDFLVLLTPDAWEPQVSHLLRVDPNGAPTTLEASFPGLVLQGLDRTWDGHLVTLSRNNAVVRIDPSDGSWEARPLVPAISGTWSPVTVDARGLLHTEDGEDRLTVDPFSGQVSHSGVGLPNAHVMGMEITGDDVIYTSGLAADIWRFDPAVGTWENVVPNWNVMSNCYDLCFTQVVDGVGFESICEGLPNSTGMSGTLELLGTSMASDLDLELASHSLPLGAFGYYVLGPNAGSSMVGHGELCITTPIYRFDSMVLNSANTGMVRMPLDLTQLPGHGMVQPGDSLIFQLWHRDLVAGLPTSNFSAAVRVNFQ